jgi:hypothetical protein
MLPLSQSRFCVTENESSTVSLGLKTSVCRMKSRCFEYMKAMTRLIRQYCAGSSCESALLCKVGGHTPFVSSIDAAGLERSALTSDKVEKDRE